MSIDELLITDLQSLGLTLNETKVLIALIKLGNSARVTKINEESRVARNKIYQSLEGLEKKKIVTKDEIKGSGNVYRLLFNSPTELINYLQEVNIQPIETAANRSVSNLVKIAGIKADKKETHEVWVIKEIENVSRIEKEIIDSANQLILSNLYPEFLKQIIPNLKKAKERGVQIKLAMLEEEKEKLREYVELKSISTSPIVGMSIKKFKSLIESIPFEGELKENLSTTVSLFTQFLQNRPNFLMVDPDSENPTALLIFESEVNPPYSSAIQTTNREFINSFSLVMDLILTIATNLGSVQDQFIGDI